MGRSIIRVDRGWLGAIQEQHSWPLAPPHFKIIASTPLAYNLTHILSRQGRVRLLQWKKEDVFGSLQLPGCRQFFADKPERFAHMRKEEHQAKLPHLAQADQDADQLQEEPHKLAAQPSLAVCSTDKFSDHAFGLLRPSPELYIGRQAWIFELQVVGEHSKDMGEIFGPARQSKIYLGNATMPLDVPTSLH